MIDCLLIIKEQYESLERVVVAVCKIPRIEPNKTNTYLKTRPKFQDMQDLQVIVNCLLKKNEDLKAYVAVKDNDLSES